MLSLTEVRGNLVSLGYEAAHVDEEPVAGNAGSHEVVIQVTVNVQFLSCNLQGATRVTQWVTK